MPVYERGVRVRDPTPDSFGLSNSRPLGGGSDNRPEDAPEEELPIES